MLIKLAWRSLWRSRRRTLITVSSIGLGLMFAIFFISMAEGMYEQLIDQVVRMQAGYVTMQHPDYARAPSVDLYIETPQGLRPEIESWPRVDQTKLLVLGQGIAKSGAGNVAAGLIGVEPSVEAATSPLARNMVEGEYLDDSDEALVVVGNELADRLNLKVGRKMVLATNDVNGDLVEELCRVKGIFHTGSTEVDVFMIQMPLPFARKVFRLPDHAATQLGVVLKDSSDEKLILNRVRAKVEGRNMVVLPWQEVLPDLASYIKMDKGSNLVFQGVLIFLVLFTIFNTILMSVLERQREFAMLMALGTSPRLVAGQIFVESIFLGLLGCLLGIVLGGVTVWWGHVYGIDMSAILGESISISGFALTTKIITKVSASIFAIMCLIVMAATIIISFIPMHRAARIDLAETLR